MTKLNMKIKVTTVQHGFALEIEKEYEETEFRNQGDNRGARFCTRNWTEELAL